MSSFTINDFWRRRLTVSQFPSASLIRGWSVELQGLSTFLEAPLSLSGELGEDDDDPSCSEIILVSAPGAVGKSTLARQIAYSTGAVYVDLAAADPVGGNTLSGGLAKSGLYASWQNQTTAVLVDGLDEARLRVTQGAFNAFLDDVVQMARGRAVPTVLFGRTGAVQDTWLALDEYDIGMSVLEIGYYDLEASVEFAVKRLRQARPHSHHAEREREAIEVILRRLREQTESDGDRFAGYAPVLQAVADRVEEEGNAGAIIAQVERGAQPVTLRTVSSAIMLRERGKLAPLPFSDPKLHDVLYLPEEQLDRLVARRYGLPDPELPPMGASDAQVYSTALETWVADHPFLKSGTSEPSSAVFDALISTWALKKRKPSTRLCNRNCVKVSPPIPFCPNFTFLKPRPRNLFLYRQHISGSFTLPSVPAFPWATPQACWFRRPRTKKRKRCCALRSRFRWSGVMLLGLGLFALKPSKPRRFVWEPTSKT